LAIGGKTTYPNPAEAKVKRALIMKAFSPKTGGISCEYIAAKVAKMNARIRRKTNIKRTNESFCQGRIKI